MSERIGVEASRFKHAVNERKSGRDTNPGNP